MFPLHSQFQTSPILLHNSLYSSRRAFVEEPGEDAWIKPEISGNRNIGLKRREYSPVRDLSSKHAADDSAHHEDSRHCGHVPSSGAHQVPLQGKHNRLQSSFTLLHPFIHF